MGRWGDGEYRVPGVWEKLKNILYILIIIMQDYRTRKSKYSVSRIRTVRHDTSLESKTNKTKIRLGEKNLIAILGI
ncbi:hypothetical protein D5R40_16560 [Okeania hirsuta]|uniref:Uncharacterized protein n=1 Tax=Okeania hirsuta TaxID=1458930 RepID=A0A3N6PSA0_9CYAN|nr:hypothetical protein D4Z78_29850 [Okeania hirsuta]RQH39658.1 hypothetical protein D5R40_16560 [Okeania hirsuta]